MDFAFFAVNFGYAKADYEALTPREIAFIYKAWENKLVSETTHLRNAMFNAISNAMRKKGKKFQELWKRKSQSVDKEVVKDNIKVVQTIEQREGKGWIEKIYQANGFKLNKKGGEKDG